MPLDLSYCMELMRKQPKLSNFRIWPADPSNPRANFERLYNSRGEIEPQLFAYCLRELLKMNAKDVPVDLRVALLKEVDHDDLMLQEELDTLSTLGDSIEVFRGASYDELEFGLSWSLEERVAEDFCKGKLLRALIPKESVLAYFNDQDEDEIIAQVPSDEVEVLEEDPDWSVPFEVKLQKEIDELARYS